MENEKKTQYTEEGYEKLVTELEMLKARRPEIKAAIAEARAFGDLSENSEYDEAKNEQAKVETRIAELEHLINHAEIIKEDQYKSGVVNIGTTVKVYDEDDEEEVDYVIVGPNEANPMMGLISDQSPIGRALIGHKKGDEVTVEAPAGEYKMKILDVQRNK
ncbi:MAG: transcription elongation factor GreA [Clostridia bacterium]|nr:transcription elongation factor GreA [Clostridia bacterium]